MNILSPKTKSERNIFIYMCMEGHLEWVFTGDEFCTISNHILFKEPLNSSTVLYVLCMFYASNSNYFGRSLTYHVHYDLNKFS